MHAQDSSDPTGISGETGGTRHSDGRTGGNQVTRARTRKANAAIQMRLGGATWTEIAVALGYPTARTALVAVEKALEKELTATGDREKMRRLAGARLDRLLRAVWPKAIDTQHPEQMQAVAKAREVIADHRRLFGLDEPAEVVVHSPTQAELEQWVLRVVTAAPDNVEEADIFDAEVVEDHALPTGT